MRGKRIFGRLATGAKFAPQRPQPDDLGARCLRLRAIGVVGEVPAVAPRRPPGPGLTGSEGQGPMRESPKRLEEETMRIDKGVWALVVASSLGLAATTGCREQGPAEKAGAAIDNALDDVGDEAEKAKEKMDEAFE